MNAAARRLIVYARLEPTTDPHAYPSENRKDVVIYQDEAAAQFLTRFPWWSKLYPDRRRKWLTIGHDRRHLQWLPEAGTGHET